VGGRGTRRGEAVVAAVAARAAGEWLRADASMRARALRLRELVVCGDLVTAALLQAC